MTHFPASAGATLAESAPRDIERALRADGLWLDLGSATVRVCSDSGDFARQLQQTYPAFACRPRADWADVHVQLLQSRGVRRWVRPQVKLYSDGRLPFAPFPADSPLPLFEWGCNWLIGQQTHDKLLLHAGAVERDGLALVMPAVPGSGKSTLTSALSLRGWRLLSDEFGVYDPAQDVFRAMLKPVALKNQSIDVMRGFAPTAQFGPVFPKTRKGAVCHLAASADAVARCQVPARPGAFVLPKWQSGSPTRLEPLAEHRLFPALAFNAFNYGVLGAVGFRAVIGLVRRCPGWHLVYSDLDEALVALERIWAEVRAHHARGIA